MARTEADTVGVSTGEALMVEVSNAISKLYKTHLGVGPRRARSHLTDDFLVCMIEGGFTPLERTLTRAEQKTATLQARLAIQEILAQEMVAAVERILGRHVRSFMSSSDPDKDVQMEAFVFGEGEPTLGAGSASLEGTLERHREAADRALDELRD